LQDITVIKTQTLCVQTERSKTTGESGNFNYLDCLVTNDARCTCEIKSRIAMAKAAFNKKTLHQQTELKSKEETSKMPRMEHSFV
jgi:hypothetical protein